jgi:hypothetical protein
MQVQMASKLDLAAIVAAACAMLSIEHGNYIFTDVPARTERSALAAAECPDNDNMPYPASCLIFLEGKPASEVRHRSAAGRGAVARPAAVKQDESISPDAECPAKDTVPYSASCIAFLTGWFWQPDNTSESAAGLFDHRDEPAFRTGGEFRPGGVRAQGGTGPMFCGRVARYCVAGGRRKTSL